LPSAFFLLPSSFCLCPLAFCLLPSLFSGPFRPAALGLGDLLHEGFALGAGVGVDLGPAASRVGQNFFGFFLTSCPTRG
jgi:hypothetical protein